MVEKEGAIEKMEKIIESSSPPTNYEVERIGKIAHYLSINHSTSKKCLKAVFYFLKLFPHEKRLRDALREFDCPERVIGILYLVKKRNKNIESWIKELKKERKYLEENKKILSEFMQLATQEGVKNRLVEGLKSNQTSQIIIKSDFEKVDQAGSKDFDVEVDE